MHSEKSGISSHYKSDGKGNSKAEKLTKRIYSISTVNCNYFENNLFNQSAACKYVKAEQERRLTFEVNGQKGPRTSERVNGFCCLYFS